MFGLNIWEFFKTKSSAYLVLCQGSFGQGSFGPGSFGQGSSRITPVRIPSLVVSTKMIYTINPRHEPMDRWQIVQKR